MSSSKSVVAVIVMGRSPRHDFKDIYNQISMHGHKVIEVGCLDDAVTLQSCKSLLGPEMEEEIYTILPGGLEVRLSKKEIEKAGLELIRKLKTTNTGLIVAMCSSQFDAWEQQGVVTASNAVKVIANKNFKGRRVGVLVPLESQKVRAKEKWCSFGFCAELATVAPNRAIGEVTRAINQFRRMGINNFVLDCMSYRKVEGEQLNIFPKECLLLARECIIEHSLCVLASKKYSL